MSVTASNFSSAEVISRAVQVIKSDELSQAQKISFLNLLNVEHIALDSKARDVMRMFSEGNLEADTAVEMILQHQSQMQREQQEQQVDNQRHNGKRNRSDNASMETGSVTLGGHWAIGQGERCSPDPSGTGRALKAARWDLNAVRPGQELSFLADTMAGDDEEMVSMHHDNSFLCPPPTRSLGVRNISTSSATSFDPSECASEIPDTMAFRRSHEVLRAKLRRGERLEEHTFEKIEEVGALQIAGGQMQAAGGLLPVGGSGRVYKMRLIDDPNNVVCAMKTVPLHLQATNLDQFEQDVRLAYGHQHPNIMPLYDVCIKRMEGNSQNIWQLCIYMHYADCGSLSTLKSNSPNGILPVLLITGVAAQMLEALKFLHNVAHVCHRDLKPSNILLRSDGRVMLQDFGNSRQLPGTLHSMRTYVGTQVYMSPERINGVQYTTKSDVWALALILMESLVGRFPYEYANTGEGSIYELLERIVDDQVPVHLLVDAMVPDMMVLFLQRTLLKDQASRPSSEQLLCDKQEAKQASRGEFENCYRAGEGIGIMSNSTQDREEKIKSARIYALPGAAQRAVESGLVELAMMSSEISVPPAPDSSRSGYIKVVDLQE